jgi:UDP-N-acetyl-D-mannosaminouronate:lipid I N-acetyl-D-mannosaminouronosyltransferase
MESRFANNVRCFAPASRKELINYAFEQQSILIAVNAEKILHATDESRAIINRNVGYPDGFGAVAALKQKGCTSVVKIPGCELWLDIIGMHQQNKKFYLVGGKQEVIEATVNKLRVEFPEIRILNFRNGYLNTEAEKKELLHDIVQKQPDVVFVAMGSPKQELLMEEMRKQHQAVYQGLGGSFDLYIGLTKRAPEWWMKYIKWEGLYRSFSDITNIDRWKRQKTAFVFLWKLWRNKL